MLNISSIEILAVLADVRKTALFHIFAIRYVLLADIMFYWVVFLKFEENIFFPAEKIHINKKFYLFYVPIC